MSGEMSCALEELYSVLSEVLADEPLETTLEGDDYLKEIYTNARALMEALEEAGY